MAHINNAKIDKDYLIQEEAHFANKNKLFHEKSRTSNAHKQMPKEILP